MKIHMKRKHDGFLPGRSSGQFMANNPPLYTKSVQFGHATVADSVGDTFEPRYIPQQAPLEISHSAIYRPLPSVHDQRHGGLSQQTVAKIEELKRLMDKYPRYHTNSDGIIRLAIYNSINGDDTLLDNKLEQLRSIDGLAKY
jgi:hypothetical protein